MKLLFLTNVPSPYRVDFFNELGKKCELTVLFEKDSSDERDESWKQYQFRNFTGVVLKGKHIATDSAFCPSVITYVTDRSFDKIICSNFTSLTGMLAIQIMKWLHISYYLECDGGFAKGGNGLKEQVKKYFIAGASGYFSTGKATDEYYIKYGAKATKIIRYPFSSVRETDILNASITIKEKAEMKRCLGISEENAILTVGQFIHRKGFDVLLKAISQIPKSVGVYFVGGQPTDEYLHLQESLGLSNIHFVGFKDKNQLSSYYKAADLFVLPTRYDIWGLVVGEAMAYGLPVITTNRCLAGLEMVQEGVNGYLVEIENVEQLSEKIETALSGNLEDMAVKSLAMANEYTLEKMVDKHIKVLGIK